MGNYDFSGKSPENYEEKCLCVLVLDLSGSMNEVVEDDGIVSTGKTTFIDGKTYEIVEGGVSKLDHLKLGLKQLYEDILSDNVKAQRMELCVLSFNDNVTMLQEPSLVSDSEIPDLIADGNTKMVDAVNEAISVVNARKQWYKETHQNYYRSWIILLTDGDPDSDQDIEGLAQRIKQDTADKRYVFMPIGVDKANMEVLQRIQGDIPAMKLRETRFSSFFKWLSASLGIVVSGNPSDIVDLPHDINDISWMDRFKI